VAASAIRKLMILEHDLFFRDGTPPGLCNVSI